MGTGRGVLTLILLVLCGIGALLDPPSELLMVVGFVGTVWSGWPAWVWMLSTKKE